MTDEVRLTKTEFEKLVNSMLETYFDGSNLVQVHQHLVSLASFNDKRKRFVICVECRERLDKHAT